MTETYDINLKRELFIDDFLTQQKSGDMCFKLHEAIAHEPDLSSPIGHYQTVIRDGNVFRRYYRGHFSNFMGVDSSFKVKEGVGGEFTGYAESYDGLHWRYPELDIYDSGVPNVIQALNSICTHNFTPFIDANPHVSRKERFKALGGTFEHGGLFGYYSADGIHFKQYKKTPVITADKKYPYAFDSQNVAFYSEAEGQYVLYYRVNIDENGIRQRSIARAVSADFIHWHQERELNVNLKGEHLYVNQMHPYCRAKHLYIGTPTRFFEDRDAATDISLFFSRSGGPIIRPFPGGWIRPGLDKNRWGNRSNYLALNIIETRPDELSLYHNRSQVRYTLRPDGFISLSSGIKGGQWQSKLLRYGGGDLEFNVSTSAGGTFMVELQNADGKALTGFSFADSQIFYGDSLAYRPQWNGSVHKTLHHGQVFRISCKLADADIYSFAFGLTRQE
jgi:hypothetical protein